MHIPPIRHCTACGTPVTYRVPEGDSRRRAMCPACGHIQYENPRNIVGTIPAWDSQVLLCRRAIEPRLGLWTLPAGFMEIGESTEAGALRETREEAGAEVALDGLYAVINVLPANQVYFFYRGALTEPRWQAGEESLEVRLFAEAEIPWEKIAFRSVAQTLQRYFADLRSGQFQLQTFDIV
ncbi:NADH pyrophosphatase [mine drainage metagenome]|uniref:NADH pyrophosphatase n=1 Tax=mine drainage metagenome TaxID=410659 RepID=A0A1J5Q090_9ZZZZ